MTTFVITYICRVLDSEASQSINDYKEADTLAQVASYAASALASERITPVNQDGTSATSIASAVVQRMSISPISVRDIAKETEAIHKNNKLKSTPRQSF